jgi:hypothetical protein
MCFKEEGFLGCFSGLMFNIYMGIDPSETAVLRGSVGTGTKEDEAMLV